MDITDKLKYLRREKGVTQAQIAKYLNITKSAYSNYEQGIRQPDYDTLKKMCDYFEVTADFMIGREKEDGTKIILATNIRAGGNINIGNR